MDGGEIAILKILIGLLLVKDATPLGLSQQYEAQHSHPDTIFNDTGD